MSTCAECQASLAEFSVLQRPDSDEIALRLDRQHPQCSCETYSVSRFSDGPIEPDEILIRILVAPPHSTKKMVPRASALSDAEVHGLSVFREKTVSDEEIFRSAEMLVQRLRAGQFKDKAGVIGVLRMRCDDIRTCKADGDESGSYCVYDTAEQDKPSHAEAFQRLDQIDRSVQEDRRRILFDKVKASFLSVEEFRNGLLKDFAPKS